MGEDERRDAELLRRFEAVISGGGLEDLRQLADDLLERREQALQGALPRRPELRRPPSEDLKIFRLRVDLKGSRPPIWRRLDVRSDLTLDVIHHVLQAAFGWTDTHLHRFSLGGGPFDRASQLFLCRWEVEEGDYADEGGLPADAVRLDETMRDPGDVLVYAYDFGEGWELTLRMEGAQPAPPDAPSAVAVDGRRAAPPEDCGGRLDAQSLAEVLEDPARFDLDEVNAALRSGFTVLVDQGLDPRVADLVNRLSYSPVGEDLSGRAVALLDGPSAPEEETLRASLRAFTWFLDRAADGGIPLTSAGYLKPAEVQAAARVLPTMDDWIGKANREVDTTPVLHFRKLLQSLGLLRKFKGTLRLTRAGAAAQSSPEVLWSTLIDKLTATGDGFDADATWLVLVYAATSADAELPLGPVVAALTHLGWRTADGDAVQRYDLYWLPVIGVLANVSVEPTRWRISPVAAALARAALRRP